MECPFCGKQMVAGCLIGDARTKVRFIPKSESEKESSAGVVGKVCAVIDNSICGKNNIDADYSWNKFSIDADYCPECRKMIISTDIGRNYKGKQ